MKKMTTGIVLLLALTTGYAQLPPEADALNPGAAYAVNHPLRSPAIPYAIPVNAMRNFYNRYGDAHNESWYITDFGFRAKFQQNNISFIADYNKKGLWLSTIKTYGENELPKAVREQIRRTWYDHHIFLVQEINQRGEPVYLVSIENARSWMKLRLSGDEMETVAVYEK
jgi:hypothetical protein